MRNMLCAFLALVHICAFAVDARDCLPILKEKDYLNYAIQNKLSLDYLATIDQQTWETAQKSNDLGFAAVLPVGVFNLTDNYNSFDSKRTSYFNQIHYKRDAEQSKQVISLTTSPRAFDAYSECLHSMNGAGILVWAEREDMNTVTVRVRFANPSGVTHAYLKATVAGGSVKDVESGRLWSSKLKFWPVPKWHADESLEYGVNEERSFVVNRTPGTAVTTITVTMEDGTDPVSYVSSRADGMISSEYVGTIDVLRQADKTASVDSPNNDHNTNGQCINEAGRENHVCVSRTEVKLAVNPPYILKNPHVSCDNQGCGWTDRYGGGGLAWFETENIAHGSLRNWGTPVKITLHADMYQRIGAPDCVMEGPVPVIFGQNQVLDIKNECLPISVLHYKLFADGSAGNVRPGDVSATTSPVVLVNRADLNTATTYTVRLKAPTAAVGVSTATK